MKGLRQLRKSLNVSITIPNERIFKVTDANTAITDAFSMVNKSLIESLESLIDLIYNPGIINIDFADLRAILRGRGSLAFLNTAEASGKDRADQVIQKILNNPLYQNNNFTVEKILFNVAGGGNLSMFEVDKISRAISQENQKAKIIFGISKSTKLKNKIKTTLLMTGSSLNAEPAVAEIKPEMLPVKIEAVKEPAPKKKIVPSPKAAKKLKKPKKAQSKPKKKEQKQEIIEKIPFPPDFAPGFTDASFLNNPAELSMRKLEIVEMEKSKKAIRRTALEIKETKEREESEQSLQEKEWEIPAFLRLKK